MPSEFFDWTFLTTLGIKQEEITGGSKPKAGDVYVVPATVINRLREVLEGSGFSLGDGEQKKFSRYVKEVKFGAPPCDVIVRIRLDMGLTHMAATKEAGNGKKATEA